jgi:O-antigen/teichoic acid export membrane protein
VRNVKLSLSPHMREIVRGASVAFILKVVAAFLNFAFNVVLARMLGVEGSGAYFLALTIVTIAATIGRVGMNNALIRFIASSVQEEDWKSVKGVYQKGIGIALLFSAGILLVLFFLSPLLAVKVFRDETLIQPLRLMSLSVVPAALFYLYAQLLKGLKRIRDAVLVESVLVYVFAILGVFLLSRWQVVGAVTAYLLATSLTWLMGWLLWRSQTLSKLKHVQGHFETEKLLKSSIPMFWVTLFQLAILWSSTLMIGMWTTKADVGVFSAANRTALLVSFVLLAVNSISAPKFAALFSAGNIRALGHTARNTSKIMILFATPVLLVFLLFPKWVLAIFGHDFIEGSLVLQILSIGQYINVVTGSVGIMLTMCGYEKIMRNIMAFSALTAIILNIVLIPHYGITGAAISSALALITQNVVASIFVWQKLRIRAFPFFGSEWRIQ